MHFFKVPAFLPLLVPSAIWRVKTLEKMIFLTFDDGPQPEVTPWVLNELEKHHAKATFFSVGNNLKLYPDIAESIVRNGHSLANHTLNHIKGWNTPLAIYQNEIFQTNGLIADIYRKIGVQPSTWCFRPPYGRITRSQLIGAKQQGLHVIMWTQLSCDYDVQLDCDLSLQALKRDLKPGSIVVFHDSQKAFQQLKQLLPAFLAHAAKENYSFGLFNSTLPQFGALSTHPRPW
jgi:peptidoglycan/xylan/chitin deacetylase (PgdA/CDA1 family)